MYVITLFRQNCGFLLYYYVWIKQINTLDVFYFLFKRKIFVNLLCVMCDTRWDNSSHVFVNITFPNLIEIPMFGYSFVGHLLTLFCTVCKCLLLCLVEEFSLSFFFFKKACSV